jgi:hypothetical protein
MHQNNGMKNLNRVMRIVWAAMALCWFVQAYATRFTQEAADGISYMEIARQIAGNNWHALLNTYWSPGYPLLLALGVKLFSPAPARELLMMRVIGWLSLLATLAAFEYFLRTFLRLRDNFLAVDATAGPPLIGDTQFRVLAYGLFFWCTTVLVPSSNEHPDILVFAVYLLASAIAMDLLTFRRGIARYALLGAVLALGFVVKAILFPLGFVFLFALACYRTQWNWKLVLGFAVFVIGVIPLIAGLSMRTHRFTIGDVGPVARAQTMGLYDFANLSPGTPVAAAPHIQIFTDPIWQGSYPPWTEPSIRFTGHVPYIPLKMQLNKTHIVLRFYFDMFVGSLGALTCCFVVLALIQRNLTALIAGFLRQTVVWMPAIAGLGAYATLRIEGRFLPAFVMGVFVALGGALVWNGPPPPPDKSGEQHPSAQTVTKYLVYAAAAILALQGIAEVGHTASSAARNYPDATAAAALTAFGVMPGDGVGFLGNGLEDHLWAHVAGVEIVGEIPKDDVSAFWAATPQQKREALAQLEAAHAKALITTNVPPPALAEGWKQLAGTQYYILPLPQ